MTRLASDRPLREQLGLRAHAYWQREHTLQRMFEDYEVLIARAIAAPFRAAGELPAHLRDDATGLARRLTAQVGVTVDFLSA